MLAGIPLSRAGLDTIADGIGNSSGDGLVACSVSTGDAANNRGQTARELFLDERFATARGFKVFEATVVPFDKLRVGSR